MLSRCLDGIADSATPISFSVKFNLFGIWRPWQVSLDGKKCSTCLLQKSNQVLKPFRSASFSHGSKRLNCIPYRYEIVHPLTGFHQIGLLPPKLFNQSTTMFVSLVFSH